MLLGTEEYPIRPSSASKILKCPSGWLLSILAPDDSDGGKGAQTGSLVHKAVEVFHRTLGDPVTRGEAAVAELARAAAEFPKGDQAAAARWTRAYVTDPKNISAVVTELERRVQLTYDGVYFAGTLDQVRVLTRQEYLELLPRGASPEIDRDSYQCVFDLKTGTSMELADAISEYQVQQAIYVLAARQTIHPEILPGGLIWAVGYDKPIGTRHPPMGLTVADCERLVAAVARRVNDLRAGIRDFTPSAASCKFCPHKAFPRCIKKLGDLQ